MGRATPSGVSRQTGVQMTMPGDERRFDTAAPQPPTGPMTGRSIAPLAPRSGPVSWPDGDDIKERVRDATDIADLVSSYITLRRQGKNLVGLCPWHDDAKPSFNVNPERQTFRCWVCDIGGDVYSFLMRMEKIEFREALEQLAERAGIDLPRGRGGVPVDERKSLHKVLTWACDRFADHLRRAPDAEPARAYLRDRGLSLETIERFQLGFAPAAWDWLLRQAPAAGFSAELLARAGLAVERQERGGHYDRFRDRVMFPIRDPQGRCVAFGGRVLPGSTEGAKYINSPETPVFSKSSLLYGLDSSRDAMARTGRAVVVEGYTDCLAARQIGCDDVVAVLGTALGERHAKLLRRYADRLVLVLDGDEAGRRRADEVLDVLLAEPIDIRIARMPDGVDPCEFALEQGREAFEALVESAVDALDYRLEEAAAKVAGRGDDAALAAVESVLVALSRVSDRSTLAPSQRRLREDQVLGRLARRFGLSREALLGRLSALRKDFSARMPATVETDGEPRVERFLPVTPTRLPAWDREVLEVLVGVPEAMGLVIREIPVDDLEHRGSRTVLETARRMHAEGREVSLGALLLELTDPALHSLLVAVDSGIHSSTAATAADRLSHLEEALRQRRADRDVAAGVRTLKSSSLDAEAEAFVLEQLVATRREAQGMTEPKDG
ncbi:MAG: DNA primase [Planctomycetota bacterium]|nr:MAG: DNA primase [Planctomycetota bacterium]